MKLIDKCGNKKINFCIDKAHPKWQENVLSDATKRIISSKLIYHVSYDFNAYNKTDLFRWHDPPAPLVRRFLKAVDEHPKKIVHIGVAFHGTNKENIQPILQEGLDPSKRRRNAYGPGEYFSTLAGIALGYTKSASDTQRILVFLVIDPYVDHRPSTIPCSYIVVSDNHHQLPIGTLQIDKFPTRELCFLQTSIADAEILILHHQTRNKILSALRDGKVNKASKIYRISTQLVWGKDGKPPKLSIHILKELAYHIHIIMMSQSTDLIEYYFPGLPPQPSRVIPTLWNDTNEWDAMTTDLEKVLQTRKQELRRMCASLGQPVTIPQSQSSRFKF